MEVEKAADPLRSSAALQKLAHHASFWSAVAKLPLFPLWRRSTSTNQDLSLPLLIGFPVGFLQRDFIIVSRGLNASCSIDRS